MQPWSHPSSAWRQAIAFDITFEDNANWDADLAASIDLAGNVVLLSTYQIKDGVATRDRLSTRLISVARGIGPWLLAKDPSRRVDRYWTFNPQLNNAPTLPVVTLQVCARPLLPTLFNALGRIRPERFAAVASLDPETVRSVALFALMRDIRLGIKEFPGTSERLLAAVPSEIGDADSMHRRCLMALIRAYDGRAGYFANFYGPFGTIRTIDGDGILAEELRNAAPLPQNDLQDTVAFVGVSDVIMPQRDAHFTVFSIPDGVRSDLRRNRGHRICEPADRPADPADVQSRGLSEPARVRPGDLCHGLHDSGLSGSFACVAVGITYAAIAQLQFSESGIWMFVFIPVVVQLPLAVLSGAVLQRLDARRQRANLQQAVEYYVPKHIAETMAVPGIDPAHGRDDRWRVLSRPTSSASPRSRSRYHLQELTEMLNRHFALISSLPEQYGCTIFDYHGRSHDVHLEDCRGGPRNASECLFGSIGNPGTNRGLQSRSIPTRPCRYGSD